ncbi:MAG: hypothetical protein Kow00121_58820 [Elainellaceae cyanobacterium]
MEVSSLISAFDFDAVSVDTYGRKLKYERHQAYGFTETLGNGVALEMVQIPEGTAYIGSPQEEGRSSDEDEPHPVTLPPFFISKYPITQIQWRTVASLPKVNFSLSPEPSYFKGLNRPVEQVSWYDAVEFCARLSRASGRLYRLPTEVEWEYACRAGTTAPFHFGETLSTDLANYRGEDRYNKRRGQRIKGSYGNGSTGINRQETTEVGYFQAANGFGLYDMHGNVWEWCCNCIEELWADIPGESQKNLVGEDNRYQQPLRGGSWKSSPAACRSAFRLTKSAGCREAFIGFRVVYSTKDDFINSNSPPAVRQESGVRNQGQTINYFNIETLNASNSNLNLGGTVHNQRVDQSQKPES